MERNLVVLALALTTLVVFVSGDYGHGGHQSVVSVPGGGKGKWQIKAKGKGMQNLITHHGGYEKKHYDHHEEKKQIVYYPVPIHHEEYGHGGGYKKDYSHKHEVSIIPLYDHGGGGGYGGGSGYGGGGGYGGGYHRRYGSSAPEYGDYYGYQGYGNQYKKYRSYQ